MRPARPVTLVARVRQGHPGRKENPALRGHLARPGAQGRLGNQASLALLDPPALQDHPHRLDPPETRSTVKSHRRQPVRRIKRAR